MPKVSGEGGDPTKAQLVAIPEMDEYDAGHRLGRLALAQPGGKMPYGLHLLSGKEGCLRERPAFYPAPWGTVPYGK